MQCTAGPTVARHEGAMELDFCHALSCRVATRGMYAQLCHSIQLELFHRLSMNSFWN